MLIPIKIYPAYWIFTGILSLLLAQGDILQTLIWMVIILVSVVFHEFGHALTAKMVWQKASHRACCDGRADIP
jgi:stage IV sporulation protein FB